MEQESVVESNEVLLEDATTSSPTDIQLAQSIANTRIVAQDTVYLVEDVEVETAREITGFYRSITGSLFSPNIAESLSSVVEGQEVEKSDLTIGEMTTEHIGRQPKNSRSDEVWASDLQTGDQTSNKTMRAPIEPVEYDDGQITHTFYFAEVAIEKVARITLRGDNGERQTVYKKVSEQDINTVNNYVGSLVEFDADDRTVSLTGVSGGVPDQFDLTPSIRERVWTILQKLVHQNPNATFLLGGGWIIGAILNWSEIITDAIFIFVSVLFGVVTMLQVLSIVTSNSTKTSTDSTDKISLPQTISTKENVGISLEQPEILETEYDSVYPVTKETVVPQFDESSLTLTLQDGEESVEWEYETNDDNVFVDSEIAEFYTELGFNILDQQTFNAYISTRKYPDTSPCLVTNSDIDNQELYMYPEDPTPPQSQ